MTKTIYKLIHEATAEDLRQVVQFNLDAGFVCQGGVCIWVNQLGAPIYHQAMTKEIEA